jgi:hypothetical protein
MLKSFLKECQSVNSRINSASSFSTFIKTESNFEEKIQNLLNQLGACQDADTKFCKNIQPSVNMPLVGIKYSLDSKQLPDVLLLEFYTNSSNEQFLQILEEKESINPRLMRNVNYVSADNSIVLPIKAGDAEELELINDIKKSANEFYKNIARDRSI